MVPDCLEAFVMDSICGFAEGVEFVIDTAPSQLKYHLSSLFFIEKYPQVANNRPMSAVGNRFHCAGAMKTATSTWGHLHAIQCDTQKDGASRYRWQVRRR